MSLSFAGNNVEELGLDVQADTDLNTGAVRVSVAILVPGGRHELEPKLSLGFRSGRSNSAFGAGWALGGVAAVIRAGREGSPRYDDSDTFSYGGAELVLWLESVGAAWRQRTFARDGHTVLCYRAQIESAYLRAERWIHDLTRREHWRLCEPDGTVTVCGRLADDSSRVFDQSDARRVYAWLPELTCDSLGDAIAYVHVPEDRIGIVTSTPAELARAQRSRSEPQRYLKRVLYGNSVPVSPALAAPPGLEWHFEVVLDYGDHSDAVLPAAAPDRPWTARADAFSACGAGFELRTYRLCRRVLVFHRFPELGPAPVLTGMTRCEYKEDPAGTVLAALDYVGVRRDLGTRAMPPVRFQYSEPELADAFETVSGTLSRNTPVGFAGERTRFVDLDGDGMPGILAQVQGGWYYKRNLGGGQFGSQQLLDEHPVLSGAPGLADFNGDGNVEWFTTQGRIAGSFSRDRDSGRWCGFRAMESIPQMQSPGRRVQWLDADNDGRADLVVAALDGVSWFGGRGDQGFVPALQRAAAPDDAIRLPYGAVADPALRLLYADMNGDGIADLVYLANGRVEYWPGLGRGAFGAPVLMDGVTQFAPDADFDLARLQLVDLDGSGTSDLVYFGNGELRIWRNTSGNALTELPPIRGLPYVDGISVIDVIDLHGGGRPVLVWSSPIAGADALRALPLTGDLPPRFLQSIDHGTGLRTELEYAHSSAMYLAARDGAEPWQTRLPRHTFVVQRIRDVDLVAGVTRTRVFCYADGAWDSPERKFIGFGLVDEFDAESAAGLDGVSTTPRCTRRWFHLGEHDPLPRLRARQYAADALQPQLMPHVGAVPAWNDMEFDASRRALVGHLLREETYAVNSSGARAAHPLRISQSCYRTVLLQPAQGGARPCFAIQLEQRIDLVYEGEPNDPRTHHHLTLDVDAHGVTRLEADIAYPRRPGPTVLGPQSALIVEVERTRVVHRDTADLYELGVPIESESFELLEASIPGGAALFERDALRELLLPLLAAPRSHGEAGPWGEPVLRRTEWARNYYWNSTRTAEAPLGTVAPETLLHHEESAAYSSAFISAMYGARAPPARLQLLGYRLVDGHWWQPAPTQYYAPADGFRRLLRTVRWDGATVRNEFDPHWLELVATVDAANNRTTAKLDYEAMALWWIADPNGAVVEVRYDPLGVVIAATNTARVRGATGATRDYGHRPLADSPPQPRPTLATLLADPAAGLQSLGTVVHYDLFAWRDNGTPCWIAQVKAESLRDDASGAAPPARAPQATVTYLDGAGQALQTKMRVERGLAPQRAADGTLRIDTAGRPLLADAPLRWLTSGHVVLNRKREPLRRYDPYFSTIPDFESDALVRDAGGVHVYQYDASGRQIAAFFPNGATTRIEFHAWLQLVYDQNDALTGSAYAAVRQPLRNDDPEKRVLLAAQAHADTPIEIHLNVEGEEVLQVDRDAAGVLRHEQRRLDAEGREIELIDTLDRVAFRYVRDMLGREARSESVDAGWRLKLIDAADRNVQLWDARGSEFEYEFDQADRLRQVWTKAVGSVRQLAEQREYGDDAGVLNAASRQLLGRLTVLRDASGVTEILSYAPDGAVIERQQSFAVAYETRPDWSAPVLLDAEVYRTVMRSDALGRPWEARLPDGTVRTSTFAPGGSLASLRVGSDDGAWPDTEVLRDATYDAGGRRESLRLGSGVQLRWTYDPDTGWLRSATAVRAAVGGSTTLQALEYRHDPVGNVVLVLDRTQEPGGALAPVLAGLRVTSECQYSYDALYRLRQARGRVHQALLPQDWSFGRRAGRGQLSLNNGQAVERYLRSYRYGPGGALASMEHVGSTRSWTTELWTSPGSNRSLLAFDPNGNPVTNPESRFDANGNALYLPHLARIAWGVDNQLDVAVVVDRSAAGGPDDAEHYVYDASGRRVRKVLHRLVAGELVITDTRYLDDCELVRTFRRGEPPTLERVTARVVIDDRPIATLHRWMMDAAGEEADAPADVSIRYTLSNLSGSAVMELGAAGEIISYEEYLPFGGTAFIAGDSIRELSLRDHQFAGCIRDDVTALCRFEFRYYAAWIGNWLSPDPLGPEDGLNLYAFAGNNPISRVDPSGLKSKSVNGALFDEWVDRAPPEYREIMKSLSPAEIQRWNRGDLWFYRAKGSTQIQKLNRRDIEKRVAADRKAGTDVRRKRFGRPPPGKKGPTGNGGEAKVDPSPSAPAGTRDSGGDGKGSAPATDQPTDDTGRSSSHNSGSSDVGVGKQAGGGDAAQAAAERSGPGKTDKDGPGGDSSSAQAIGDQGEGPGAGGEDLFTGDTAEFFGAGAGQDLGAGTDGAQGGGETQPQQVGEAGDTPNLGGQGQVGSGTAEGSGATAQGTQPGTHAGVGGGGRGEHGNGSGGDKKGHGEASEIATLVKIAGYTQLEFDAPDDGEKYGIPGGFGSHQAGLTGQFVWAAVAIITTIVSLAKLAVNIAKNGLRATLKQALKKLKKLIPAAKKLWKKAKRLRKKAAEAVTKAVKNFFRGGSGGKTGFARKLIRFFKEDRETFNIASDFFGRWRRFFQSGHGWSLEHMIVKQRWYRSVANNPSSWIYKRFPPGTRVNRFLQTVGDAGWNVLPIPQKLNKWFDNNRLVSAAFNYGFYPGAVVGIREAWRRAGQFGEDIADSWARRADARERDSR